MVNKNIAPSKVTDNVGDERGDAFRGIPKLSCLDIPWILTWGALGIPKLRVLSLLILLISTSLPKLENFNTQNLTELREIGLYDKELGISLWYYQ